MPYLTVEVSSAYAKTGWHPHENGPIHSDNASGIKFEQPDGRGISVGILVFPKQETPETTIYLESQKLQPDLERGLDVKELALLKTGESFYLAEEYVDVDRPDPDRKDLPYPPVLKITQR